MAISEVSSGAAKMNSAPGAEMGLTTRKVALEVNSRRSVTVAAKLAAVMSCRPTRARVRRDGLPARSLGDGPARPRPCRVKAANQSPVFKPVLRKARDSITRLFMPIILILALSILAG